MYIIIKQTLATSYSTQSSSMIKCVDLFIKHVRKSIVLQVIWNLKNLEPVTGYGRGSNGTVRRQLMAYNTVCG